MGKSRSPAWSDPHLYASCCAPKNQGSIGLSGSVVYGATGGGAGEALRTMRKYFCSGTIGIMQHTSYTCTAEDES